MADPFDILGIPKNSSTEDAKRAYRKLAQKNHPDQGGSTAKFQVIKEAWETIEAGYKTPAPRPQAQPTPSSFHKTWQKPEAAWEGYAAQEARWEQNRSSRAYKAASAKIKPLNSRIVEAYRPPEARVHRGDFIARVSIAEAYQGFVCEVNVENTKYQVKIPPGVPHNLRFTVPIAGKEDVTVITRFLQNVYSFKGVDTALTESTIVNSEPAIVHRTKDLSITHEVNKADLRWQKTIELQDFLGETYKVKLEPGQDFRKPIRIKGHGYVDWYPSFAKCGSVRGDVLLTIRVTEEVPFSHFG